MVTRGPWSLWQREIEAEIANWSTEQIRADAAAPTHCEILVVGAGLAGASTAAALTRAGRDVLLVDAHGPATGASGRNAGFVLLGNAVEYPLLVERFGRERCRAVLALARDNHALIRERHGKVCDYEASGSLMLAMPDDAEERETLRRAHALLAEDGAEVSFGPAHAALRGFAEQITIHEDGQVHPAKLGLAINRGVPRRALAEVTGFDWASGSARVRVTDDATIETQLRFERCVVATNAWTMQLLPQLGRRVRAERGQVLATEPLPDRVLHEVAYAGWGYDYFRQRSDGRVVLGGRRHLFVEAESTDSGDTSEQVQASLDAYLATHLPFAAGAKVTHRWAGTMGFSHDELPYLDSIPNSEGRGRVVAAFTGHGLGLTLACGELTAAQLLGTADARQRDMLRLFSLSRA